MNIMPHAVICMKPAALAGFSQLNYVCLPDFKELCLKMGVETVRVGKRALLGLRYSGKECRCVELCHGCKSSLTQSVFLVASGGRQLFF